MKTVLFSCIVALAALFAHASAPTAFGQTRGGATSTNAVRPPKSPAAERPPKTPKAPRPAPTTKPERPAVAAPPDRPESATQPNRPDIQGRLERLQTRTQERVAAIRAREARQIANAQAKERDSAKLERQVAKIRTRADQQVARENARHERDQTRLQSEAKPRS